MNIVKEKNPEQSRNRRAQVFSYEFCEIFKNTFLTENLWKTASEY